MADCRNPFLVPCLALDAAEPTDQAYPNGSQADSCGDSPGDTPFLTFEPGMATLPLANETVANRVARWGERVRSGGSGLTMLTGFADTGEAGYAPDFALRRARAVRDLLLRMGVEPSTIWVRGESVPASPDAAILGRRVSVEEPFRVIACHQALSQDRFRWFTAHCSGQSIDDATQRTCDLANEQLSGGDRPGSRGN